MDTIFKSLADPTRRMLLDRLRETDGQTLQELQAACDMSRFGVMKHLSVLEEAGLIVTRKQGRFKYHYLNAVPLQEAIDRWIEPLVAKPLARGMINLKAHMEGQTMLDTTKPDFVHMTVIRCTQDALWDALTKADQLAQYHFMCSTVKGDAVEGQPTDMIRSDGSLMLRQTTLKLDPKSRIEQTFEPNFESGPTTHSRIVFLLEAEGDQCKLTCEHYDIPEGQDGVREGWSRHVASLKSWLETGKPIKVGG